MTSLTDADIQRLLREHKPLEADFRKRFAPRRKRGHSENEFGLTGADGSEFRVIVRQAQANPLDFSVVLAYRVPNSNQLFRLRRYNGKSHQHTNSLEANTFYDFHIHQATERYQDSGFREDTFAEPTDRYSDLAGAIECLIQDCGFVLPRGSQPELF